MDPVWAERFEQSAQVTAENERKTRAEAAAEEKALREVMDAVRARLPDIGPTHRFEPYGNPDIRPGCVRCPKPEADPIHSHD